VWHRRRCGDGDVPSAVCRRSRRTRARRPQVCWWAAHRWAEGAHAQLCRCTSEVMSQQAYTWLCVCVCVCVYLLCYVFVRVLAGVPVVAQAALSLVAWHCSTRNTNAILHQQQARRETNTTLTFLAGPRAGPLPTPIPTMVSQTLSF